MATFLPDIIDIVRQALTEDIGTGDMTTLLTVPAGAVAMGSLLAKQAGVVAGLPVAAQVFAQVDPALAIEFTAEEGQYVEAGETLMAVRGSARSILTAERVALNFLQRLSGIATKTSRFVALVEGSKARIVDTRKTTPGLRALEKYAVRVGGGFNHRFGLYDAILIKDNHIQAAGGITPAVQAAYAQAPHTMTVTVECDTLEQVEEAIAAGVDIVLLDNMSLDMLRQAVDLLDGQAAAEASGGVNEETVTAIAQTGVDIISVGALTHSSIALDISLDLIPL